MVGGPSDAVSGYTVSLPTTVSSMICTGSLAGMKVSSGMRNRNDLAAITWRYCLQLSHFVNGVPAKG
jgi:hypothetical protein